MSPGGQDHSRGALLPHTNECASIQFSKQAAFTCVYHIPGCVMKDSGLTARQTRLSILAAPLRRCVKSGEWLVSEPQFPHVSGGAETSTHPTEQL